MVFRIGKAIYAKKNGKEGEGTCSFCPENQDVFLLIMEFYGL
jgi:hypothetical protein